MNKIVSPTLFGRDERFRKKIIEGVNLLAEAAKLDLGHPEWHLPASHPNSPLTFPVEVSQIVRFMLGPQPIFLCDGIDTMGTGFHELLAAALCFDIDLDAAEKIASDPSLWDPRPLGRFIRKFGSDAHLLALAFHCGIQKRFAHMGGIKDSECIFDTDGPLSKAPPLVKIANLVTSHGKLDLPELKFVLQLASTLSASQLEVFTTLVEDSSYELWMSSSSFSRTEHFCKLLDLAAKVSS